ncbi:multiple epidermal growth factor-like domains protein 8 [Culicoides brevitarsis]|uniref:multiple epidermal growth factor-like domains protein 8 n=1 Tax=Culicoides brevitarsis TaxID=469753 RepID=UPI00307BF7FF
MGSVQNALNCISFTLAVTLFLLFCTIGASQQSCDKSRKVFTQSWGEISDSDGVTNYTKDSHCEWLIRAANSSQFITLSFRSISTECAYDYIFVYDGDSYAKSTLLGSFSGKTSPKPIVAASGSMLILLYSDTNYVLDGFKADFSVTNCPNNCSSHGKCVNHKCICSSSWLGDDCSKNACPQNCHAELNQGKCVKDHCECASGYSGMSCSLKKDDPISNEYHWLADSIDGLHPRAAHTATYIEKTDSLYVFGGYDLNNVLDNLEIYRFETSQWENEHGLRLKQAHFKDRLDTTLLKAVLDSPGESPLFHLKDGSIFKNVLLSVTEGNKLRSTRSAGNNTINSENQHNYDRPSARHGHAASNVEDGFVIYGGKTSSGHLSDELWLYNISSNNRWSLRALNSLVKPPALVRHTLTYANGFLYLFGGSTSSGDFSSRMFKIRISRNSSEEQWQEVKCRGGKSLDVRVVAHTTVYYEPLNSLIVYGGITTGVARFSKLSDRMFAFNLETQFWAEILYPRTYLRDTFVPRERAFHTSVVSGNYLIVFGGYSHRHNKEEICYDNTIYLYHLGCHTWTSPEILGQSTNHSPKEQGVFAHASALRGNTLLLVGGYHGTVNGDLLAYTIPPMIYESADPESKCSNYHQQSECLSNMDCGWCSADSTCYGRTVGANCTTNLQTTRCPGICQSLGDCQSCLILGKSHQNRKFNSVAQKLGLDKCTWCVQNARCHHKDEYGICGEDTPSQDVGWWGKQGIEITSADQCTPKDKRPGLTLLRYLYPVDFNMPDSIQIINATMVDFNLPGLNTITEQLFDGNGSKIVTRLLGYIRPPESWRNLSEKLWVCSSYSQTELKIGLFDAKNLKLAANLTSDQTSCVQADWPMLEPGKIFIDLQAKRSMNSQNVPHSKIGLQHNRTTDSSRAFTFEYLEPFANETCGYYKSCLPCLSSSSCGWCDLTKSCVSRSSEQSCTLEDESQYLTLHSTKCKNCSNFISCEDCTTNDCEWWIEDARCARKGRSPRAARTLKACPVPCYQRTGCSQCLNDAGRCVWCKSTQTCFSFSVYTSEYQFGMCREWLDQVSYIAHENSSHVEANADKCENCAATNCSSCLKTLSCGWCYDKENPIEGMCLTGDFNTTSTECSVLMNKTDVEFAYAQCPDVDECGLGIHDCHPEAVCSNTHGSYQCQCRQGFIGDGKKNCTKTCFEKCIHGTCSGAPDYVCNCKLGWTGIDCSVNCGCNNHSTCETGVGVCDECQNFTEGDFCERCRMGSYGNATSEKGCTECDCNMHGNKSLGVCDPITGECFCQDNTGGIHCEVCNSEYYGDPRDGGQCYLECAPRSVLHAGQQQGLGSYQSYRPEWGGPETRECLWIISPKTDTAKGDYIIRLEVEKSETKRVYRAVDVWRIFDVYFPCGPLLVRHLKHSRSFDTKKIDHESDFEHLQTCLCATNGKMHLSGFDSWSLQFGNNCHAKQAIYIYGGLREQKKNGDFDRVFDDFWKFSLQTQRWEVVEVQGSLKPPPLCLHTMTLVKDADKDYLVLIGGLSFTHGFNQDVWLFNMTSSKWQKIECKGVLSSILFGHSTVNHQISRSLYVYGGYRIEENKTVMSNKLFALNYETSTWTELPPFHELNRPGELKGRFGHSAVTTDTYMVIYGGKTSGNSSADILIAYNYNCNHWIRLTEDTDIIGEIPTSTYAHAMTIDADSSSIYVVGGWDGSINARVVKINIPVDICSLWSRSKSSCRHYMGCSYCAIKPLTEFGSHCYSSGNSGVCSVTNDSNALIAYNSGASCDLEWIERRNCSSFTTCSECLATWPVHSANGEASQVCQWFESVDGAGSKCVSTSLINCTGTKCGTNPVTKVDQCPSLQCIANDCASCNSQKDCVWASDGHSQQCINASTPYFKRKLDVMTSCPAKCDVNKNCSACLTALSSEGGYDDCHWSTELGVCMSQSYQPVICAGGLCGLVLTPEEKDYCPESCEAFDQCQTCLRHAHCGWCAKEGTEGEGLCTQGSMAEHPAKSTCDLLFAATKNVTLKESDRFSWNYVKCPPENECENGHHNCNPESEQCFDLNYGYKCNCKEGFKTENGKCKPICREGCVRGVCTAPDVCQCDFGYVGVNCTIQCNCNGNANCKGPDKLDECGECHNNTMGSQCEKCQKWFVKNERNECVPCLEYCHGHTDICVQQDMAFTFRNLTRDEIDQRLTEGVQSDAVCLECKNQTDGPRCSSCIPGYFRGTMSNNDGCRPCQCHGHGDMCDPVTGEKCNCANNTESDLTCTNAKMHKNSVHPCWDVQCSKCRDSYQGHPTHGHQCYKQITVDSKMCFDAKTIDECKVKPRALNPGETVFFVIQPRYTNLDIRIIIDVTQGELDLFMSPQDDSFVVESNKSSGFHEIYLDHQYRWSIEDLDDGELFMPIQFSPERNKYKNYSDEERFFVSPNSDCKAKNDGFSVKDYFVRELCSYVTLTQCNTLMRVFGLKNRLVVTLPQSIHNLSTTRFFIVIRAVGTQTASYGLIFFRQDQLHIDLFVFFSVFFSCFFLFLAICVVAWKFKQAADMRRARRRHNIELIHMAQRPFSCIDLHLGPDLTPVTHRRRKSRSASSSTHHGSSITQQHAHTFAQEFCSDGHAAVATVFIRLPGRQKAPINLSMGSTLISTSNSRRCKRAVVANQQQAQQNL